MLKKLAGPSIIVLIALLPIGALLFGNPQAFDFLSVPATFDSLARMTGLSALSLLALNIILSARLPLFDRLFLGLDRAYRFHRIIGGSILILVLTHAMFMTAKYSNLSLLSGYEFLKPNLDLALMAGKFALLIFLAGVFISMYITIKYKWFIMIQRALGAMIFVAGYHALFIAGTDLQTNPILVWYFGIWGGIAAFLYIYRSIFHTPIKRRLRYVVESVAVSENIARLWLRPVGKALAFYAGQFSFFTFESDAVDDESHPFSISSGSNEERVRLSVKGIGDYTSALQGVKVGDRVSIEGPYGHFSFTKVPERKQVWVAGGIGITPFLSMAQSLPMGYDVTLFYCTRTIAEAQIFLEELEQVTRKNPGFKLEVIADDQNQRLTIEALRNSGAKDYLLCAPVVMMKDIEKQLMDAGISKSHIHYEEFRLK